MHRRVCVCVRGPVTEQKRAAFATHSSVCSEHRVELLPETPRRYHCRELHHRDPRARGTARRPPYRERGVKRGSGESLYCCATGECVWSPPASHGYVRCCGNACAHPCARGVYCMIPLSNRARHAVYTVTYNHFKDY